MPGVTESLNALLSDVQVHYQKLRNYHWNIVGPKFFELHVKFEELYNEAALEADEIAERIRTLGGRPASTFKEYIGLSSLKEDETVPAAAEMVKRILADRQAIRALKREIAKDADPATTQFLEDSANTSEKTDWMLKAYLEG